MENPLYKDKNAALKAEWDELHSILAVTPADKKVAIRRVKRRLTQIETTFIEKNTPLARNIVNKMTTSSNGSCFADEHLSEAVAEMWRLFPEWDPEKGTFSTYVTLHLRGKVNRSVSRNEQPALTTSDWNSRPAVLATKKRLDDARLELRRQGVTGDAVKPPTFADYASESGIGVASVRRILLNRVTSLDKPVGENSTSVGDLIGPDDMHDDSSDSGVVALPIPGEMYTDVTSLLATVASLPQSEGLSSRELMLVVLRTGAATDKPFTHEEIALLLGGTRERYRTQAQAAVDKFGKAYRDATLASN